jgi:FkbM family methyltransferase
MAGPAPTQDADSHVRSSLGHRLYFDPQDERGRELLRSGGTLNPGSAALWEAALALHEWDVVVDVGANYGEMILGFGSPPGARLVCFEPNPRVLPFLRRSIAESGVDVDLREVAIGARDGEARFVMDTVWSGRSGLMSTHRTDADLPLDEIPVSIRSLDSELTLPQGDSVCIKIDVEGAELDVLAGANALLKGPRAWALMLEVLHMDPYERARLAHDFTMRLLDRRRRELVVVPPVSPQRLTALLDAGWLHGQDAVLTARDGR